jgi:PAS domain S-box-containing protein
MLVVTTESGTAAPPTPTAPAERLAEFAHEGAGVDGGGRVERRRTGWSNDSPVEMLRRLPAVVVLERLPVPALAITREGVILFANTAFADMVGYGREALAGLGFPETFQTIPLALCALSGVDALANLVVELRHREGWKVRARMSNSALMRRDDPLMLVTFNDLTEQLWTDDQ